MSRLPVSPSSFAPAPDEALPSLASRFFNLRTLLSFALGFGILVFLASRMGVEVDAIWARLRQADLGYYLLALAIYYLTFIIRALRWQRLLRNVGFGADDSTRLPPLPRISVIILLSWFANCVVPAKLGDAYRAYLLKRDMGVSFSKTIGTILAERIIDTLLLVVLLSAAALAAFHGTLPVEVLDIMQVGAVLVALVAAGLLAMRKLGGRIKDLVPARFREAYGLFEEGTLGSFQALPLVLLYSVIGWFIEALRLYLVSLSLGLSQLSLFVILFVALASALLTTVPVTPAGLGFVETGMVGILLLAGHLGLAPGMDQNLATSLAVLDRTISYWSLIVFGLIAYLISRRHLRAINAARPTYLPASAAPEPCVSASQLPPTPNA